MALLLLRFAQLRGVGMVVSWYVQVFQGTPLLMQLFLVYFGLALMGMDTSPLVSAAICLTLYASAYLTEIWRGCVNSVPRGQWEASASLALDFPQQMRHVILPQALRVAIAPTVGFMVQIIKGTALASVIGFVELTKAGQMISNATYQPFLAYTFVGLLYFALCYPLSRWSQRLETRRLA
jgi:polar amino acid transport system permease protein